VSRRFLLVDDNAAFGENLAEILRDEGFTVTLAAGGPQALAVVEAAGPGAFDALLTDMRMPVMNGAELVHAIRRCDPGLPALVITAYTREDDLAAARKEGLLGVLPKPAPLQRLIELLRIGRRDGLVAIIEDDEALADNLAEALRDRGFSAINARSLLEASELRGVSPFAALVDLRLPDGPDGAAVDLLARTFPGLPILVMTAFSDCTPATGAKSREVFLKPFETGRLLRSLERLHGAAGP
jgi:DNA-binding NtrC family response regulator